MAVRGIFSISAKDWLLPQSVWISIPSTLAESSATQYRLFSLALCISEPFKMLQHQLSCASRSLVFVCLLIFICVVVVVLSWSVAQCTKNDKNVGIKENG